MADHCSQITIEHLCPTVTVKVEATTTLTEVEGYVPLYAGSQGQCGRDCARHPERVSVEEALFAKAQAHSQSN
ncbi:MAG: hypothetical protein ACLVDB_03125 [Anaeromassilibacillus sp.]